MFVAVGENLHLAKQLISLQAKLAQQSECSVSSFSSSSIPFSPSSALCHTLTSGLSGFPEQTNTSCVLYHIYLVVNIFVISC